MTSEVPTPDLTELERLLEKATPGEWIATDRKTGAAKIDILALDCPSIREASHIARCGGKPPSRPMLSELDTIWESGRIAREGEANAALIVALKNAAPHLITAARERDELKAESQILGKVSQDGGEPRGDSSISGRATNNNSTGSKTMTNPTSIPDLTELERLRTKYETTDGHALRACRWATADLDEVTHALPSLITAARERDELKAEVERLRTLAENYGQEIAHLENGIALYKIGDIEAARIQAEAERDEAQSALEDLQGEVGRLREALANVERACRPFRVLGANLPETWKPHLPVKAQANIPGSMPTVQQYRDLASCALDAGHALQRQTLNPNPEAKG